MDQYEFIRVAHRRYGKSIRQIARETGHSRVTVRKALSGQQPEYRMKKPRRAPVMDAYRWVIDAWIKGDEDRPRKQRHTAKRIYDRLVDEYDFKGSDTTVRHFVRKRKSELGMGRIEAMVPLSPDRPGEAEVDWGEALVDMDGVMKKVYLFCMRPRQSGKPFVRAYPKQSQEMFFDAHIHAFAYYGGVFPEIIYDNLKAVVAKVLRGQKREEQYRFKLFKAHYSFKARYCNVARGNEKGGVEGLVKTARRNLLVPIPEVADFEALNQLLLEGCERMSERVLSGREEERPIEALFEEEKPVLIPLPSEPFVADKQVTAKVDKYQTVRVEGVRYSVPTRYVGLRVAVAVGCAMVVVSWGMQVIARHKRCFTSGRWTLNPLHYLELLHHKIGALEHARPLREWRERWPESHNRLWARMRHRQGERNGSRAFLEVLMLYRSYSRQDMEAAVAEAESLGLSDVAGIRALLHERRPATPLQSLAEERLPLQCQRRHEPPDTAKYDRLTGGRA